MALARDEQSYQTIEVNPINPVIGAEIEGVDFTRPLSSQTVEEIHDALMTHLVIFFRDLELTPEQQVAFARNFGEVPVVPDSMFRVLPGHPHVSVLENDAERPPTVNNWHSDYCFVEKPDFASILYAHEIPALGGDTIWVNMYAVYEALSARLKAYLEGLKATHDFMKLYGRPFKRRLWEGERNRYMEEARLACPPIQHPVFRTHPVTGRKALYVNESFTTFLEGVDEPEGNAVLQYLFELCRVPEHQVRFHWRQGTMAFWDKPGYHPLRACRLLPPAPADAPGHGAEGGSARLSSGRRGGSRPHLPLIPAP